MPERSQRHRRIYKLQRGIVAGVAALVFAITGTSLGTQIYQNHRVDNAVQQVSERADFWRIIGHQASPNSTTVDDKFATDLREMIGDIDPQATTLPDEAIEFVAGPNTYGGIADELGFNPFNNSGQPCEVCGSLSPEMMDDLLLIKQGKVSEVIDAERAKVDTGTDIQLSAAGLPLPVWLSLVYLSSTTAALIIAVRVDGKRNGYNPNLLSWGHQGGTKEDLYRLKSKVLSWPYFVTVLPLSRKLDRGNNRTKDYGERLEMTNLSETERSLREAREAISQLPKAERERDEVQHFVAHIDRLWEELQDQIEHYDGDVPTLETSAAELSKRDIDRLIGEAEERLLSRREALTELDGKPPEEERGQTATG